MKNINIWLDQIQNDYKAAVSVDCVIFGYDDQNLKILLSKCDMPPFENQFSLLGDIVHPNETTDEAAYRVLVERTGISNIYLEQVQAFSAPNRHPLGRVITISYYSLIQIDQTFLDHVAAHPDLILKSVNEVHTLAFDHKLIMDTCLTKLQKNLREHPLGFKLLPSRFTLLQLQNLYESVLGITLDKRNFRRKMNTLGILKESGEIESDVPHRPAKYYYFDETAYHDRVELGFSFGF